MSKQRFSLPPPAGFLQRPDAMPFQPGTVLGKVKLDDVHGTKDLTDAERAVLEAADYKDGDPVPDLRGTAAAESLKRQAAQVRAEAADVRGLTPVDPKTPPMQPPKARKLEDLPAAEQQQARQTFSELGELQQRMKEARLQQAAKKAEPEVSPQLAAIPGYMEAMQSVQPKVNMVDDIGLTAPKKKRKLGAEPVEEQPTPPATPIVDESVPQETHCRRCGYELGSELVEPTEEDKVAYIALIMGQERFVKFVPLLGGRLVVELRSLLSKEVDLAIVQADAELRDGKITSVGQYVRAIQEYKLLMSIGAVGRTGKAPLLIPPVDEIEYDEAKDTTALPALKEYMDNSVLVTDALRRIVAIEWSKFTRLFEYLEAHAADPDFFYGIA